MSAAAELADALGGKPNGAGFMARCPAHDDSTPSLSISEASGRLLVHCHAGCEQGAVIDVLKERRLWPASTERTDSRIIATYDYRDADGALAYQVVRLEPKSFRQRRPDGDGWTWNVRGIEPLPYRLPELIAAVKARYTVFVAEGEKDVDHLRAAGIDATCNSGGAGKWRASFSKYFEGANVVIVPDHDAPGRAHAEQVAANLGPVAKSVRIVALPGLAEHGDVSDFLDTHDVADLEELAAAAPIWTPSAPTSDPPTADDERQDDRPARDPLDWRTLESQTPPERAWAIDHWLPMGHVTMLAGAPGTGKTLCAQAMGSCLAVRREYLDWMPAERRVLMWACEDEAAELWRRQAAIARWLDMPLSAFADRLFVQSYAGQLVELAAAHEQRLEPTRMLTELREQIGDYRADVVILDNSARLYAGNENDRHQVTSFMAMLTAAAAPRNAAVMLLAHPGKAVGSEYSGSTAWEGAVRGRLYLGRTLPDAGADEATDAEDDGIRYLCRRKANYSARDWRRMRYTEGVLVAEVQTEARAGVGPEYARDVVRRAVRKLATMGEHGVAATGSGKYLPRLARDYQLLERLNERQFASAMRDLRKDGELIVAVVGKYANRNPREGLTLAATPESAQEHCT